MRWRRGSTGFACLLAMACAKQPSDGPVAPSNPSRGPDGSAASGKTPVKLGRIVVSAGELDRSHSIVSFPFTSTAARPAILRDEKGNVIPLQRGAEGSATFVLPSLGKGQKAAFTVESADATATTGPVSVDRGNALDLSQTKGWEVDVDSWVTAVEK